MQTSNELIGNIVEIVTHDLWLWTNPHEIIARTFGKRGLPSRCDSAERIPDLAGDQTELRRRDAKFCCDRSISLRRRLMGASHHLR